MKKTVNKVNKSRANDPFEDIYQTMRAKEVVAFAKLVDEVGPDNIVVLKFNDAEMAALNLAAQRHAKGDAAAYVRRWLDGGIENDLDSLAHDLKEGAKP